MRAQRRIVAISGPIAAGKTRLARALCDRFDGRLYKTSDLLRERLGPAAGRVDLQEAGERLDRSTAGRWVREQITADHQEFERQSLIVIDSVRIKPQLERLRESFNRQVVHVHLTAPEEELRSRFKARKSRRRGEARSYKQAKANATERQVASLREDADIVIDTARCTPEDVFIRVARALGFYAGSCYPIVDAVIGGQYGSEGKGNIAAYLAPEYGLLVRVGGPNAGHTVLLPDGEKVTYHHLPSGTHTGETHLLLGPGCVIRPGRLLDEIAEFGVEKGRLTIDEQAMVIEDADVAAEGDLKAEIGSTGQGVGWATARRALREADPKMASVRLARDVPELGPFVGQAQEVLERAYAAGTKILLEGTQGTGLSLYHGPYKTVTSRDTAIGGVLSESGVAPGRLRRTVLVCRTYPIRVESPKRKSSGPMKREIDWRTVEKRAGLKANSLKELERTSTTDRMRRVGEFEWDQLRSAALINGPTDIAITFTDYITKKNRDARRFDQLTRDTIEFIEEIEQVTGAPVTLVSTGFDKRTPIVDRRSW
jgi:adenylosuccinate synthase